MKPKSWAPAAFLLMLLAIPARAQFPPDDRWYQNPLGFSPLRLHTAAGFILPALAVGAGLLVTDKEPPKPGRGSVYNETGLSWGYKYPGTFLPQNNTGLVFQVRGFMAIGIEADFVMARDDFNRASGAAVRPFARFFLVNDDRWRVYFESGGGLIHMSPEFPKPTGRDPRLGTRWNGMTKYGLGAEVNVRESFAVMFGVRHTHISNGNSQGVERNPSHDSNGIFIGLSRRF